MRKAELATCMCLLWLMNEFYKLLIFHVLSEIPSFITIESAVTCINIGAVKDIFINCFLAIDTKFISHICLPISLHPA